MNKILVGVPSGASVPVSFMGSYAPAGELKNGDEKLFYNHRGTNTVTARNQCVHKMLKDGFTHLFFIHQNLFFFYSIGLYFTLYILHPVLFFMFAPSIENRKQLPYYR